MARIRFVVLVALVMLGAVACNNASTTASEPTTTSVAGIEVTPPVDVGTVSLPDATAGGAPFEMVGPPKGILLVYFGYTSCPDVCPTTLADLRSALRELGPSARRVEVAMASIDPARDTAKVLTDYVRGFVPGAHALRTDDPSQLKAAASVLGVQYDVKVAADGSEDVGHTSFVYAIDPAGKLVLQWSFGTPVKDYVHDLRILLDRVG